MARILIDWTYSEWLLSTCCNAPLLMIHDYPKDLDFIYCRRCIRRIAVVLEEERYELV